MPTAKLDKFGSEARPYSDRSKVIVTAGITSHATQVHHRDIPELHTDGETSYLAAVALEQAFARELDGIIDQCRREPFVRALADIREFIKPSR
jgi:hypothetical protein